MDVKQKGILRRMFDMALNELSRRSVSGEQSSDETHGHESRGHESHVRDLPASEETQREDAFSRDPTQIDDRPTLPDLAPSPAPHHSSVVFVHGAGGSLRVRWRISAEHMQRASALLGDTHVPCLRLIFFSAASAAVTREVQDRPNVGPEGECDVRDAPERLIAVYGLRAGEKFISVAHAVL